MPEAIKIDDIVAGRVDPDTVLQELDRLKVEVNILRNDMSLFIKALATVPENQGQQEYYTVLALRLQTVKATIKEYCAQYNQLLPIINLAQIRLGQDADAAKSALPAKNGAKKRNSTGRP